MNVRTTLNYIGEGLGILLMIGMAVVFTAGFVYGFIYDTKETALSLLFYVAFALIVFALIYIDKVLLKRYSFEWSEYPKINGLKNCLGRASIFYVFGAVCPFLDYAAPNDKDIYLTILFTGMFIISIIPYFAIIRRTRCAVLYIRSGLIANILICSLYLLLILWGFKKFPMDWENILMNCGLTIFLVLIITLFVKKLIETFDEWFSQLFPKENREITYSSLFWTILLYAVIISSLIYIKC